MNVAVLGQGSIGRRHARLLLELGCSVTIFDPAPGRELVDGARAAASEEDALESCEAVVVATPTSAHLENVRRALGRGRHVLVEKPLATTAAGVRELGELAEERGLLLAVAMNLRFHAGPRRVHGLVAAGAVGTPLHAQFAFGSYLPSWRSGVDYRQTYSARAASGGGILLDAIHELDYAAWTLGRVEAVSALLSRVSQLEIDVEDVALLHLVFESGAVASIDLDYLDHDYRRGCRIVGSEATVEWDWRAGEVRLLRAGAEPARERAAQEFDSSYRREVECFVGALEDGVSSVAELPLVGAAEAEHVLAVVDAARLSAGQGCRARVG